MTNRKIDILYKTLLQHGIRNFESLETNTTGIEDHLSTNPTNMNMMKEINKYVYTTYSTNEDDNTYSIGFLILSQYLEPLMQKLREHNLWYVAKDYANDQTYINVGPENGRKEEQIVTIEKKDINHYLSNWKIMDEGKNDYTLKQMRDFYFLSKNNVDDVDNLLDKDISISEISEAGNDTEELIDYLSFILIEDPHPDHKILYNTVLEIVEDIFGQKGGSGKGENKKTRKRKSNKNKKRVTRRKRKTTRKL